MAYYIANYNNETNSYEIHVKDGIPFKLHNEKDALQLYADMCIEHGRKNILILTDLQVNLTASATL